jgi:hypothetical protein
VLHLQSRVHLEEVEALGLAVVHEFHGARAAVAHGLGQLDRRVAQRLGHAFRQVGRGSFLEHLLVAPLHRAVAHAERQHLALAISEHLDLQVPGALDVLLDEHAGIAEVALAQTLNHGEGFAQLHGRAADAHADAASAGRALEHDGIAELLAGHQGCLDVLQQPRAFQHRDALLPCQRSRGVLEAEHAQVLGRGADERHAGVLAGLREGGVFGEEAVAGMNRPGAGVAGDCQELVDRQIRARGRAFAEAVGLLRLAHVRARDVGFGIDRDALNAHGAQASQDAAGNGTAVGDEQLVKHWSDLDMRAVPRMESRAMAVHGGRRAGRRHGRARPQCFCERRR